MNKGLSLQDLEYKLPESRIATYPVSPRSSAKLLVVGDSNRHLSIKDLPTILPENSVLVINETAVLPARFKAHRMDTGGKVEGLFLREINEGVWEVMLKSNGNLREKIVISLASGITLTLDNKKGSYWHCTCSDKQDAAIILNAIGVTPLPPYILKARGNLVFEDCVDRMSYQTIYANPEEAKSVAAPTAGLHFETQMFDLIKEKGVECIPITLHVGAGTFKPIETTCLEDHVMHKEWWSVSQSSLNVLKEAKRSSRPIIAVGTTTVRTLESLPNIVDWPHEGGLSGSTALMITPPYNFKIVSGLMTNFHLPRSSLLALVSAFIGIEKLHQVYEEAIAKDYRFYSFGDAMYIPSAS